MSGYRSDGVKLHTTSSDAPRAAQRCMAMRAVCLATAVSWPHALLNRSSARSKEYDSRPTCMMPAESCSSLSRRFTTFLSSASVLLAASDFFETFVRRAPGRARRASCNEGPFLDFAIEANPSLAGAARASPLPENVKTLRSPAQVVRRVPSAQRRRRQPPKQVVDGPSRRRRLAIPTARGRIQVPIDGVKQRRPQRRQRRLVAIR